MASLGQTPRAGQSARIAWRDGVPVSIRHDDPYFSLEDGLAEARQVYLAGNGLPGRLAPGFCVAELGFGTGLNLLALVAAARDAGIAGLHYTGFELHPIDPDDMARALAAFPELAADAARLVADWRAGGVFETAEVRAEVICGDARQTLLAWGGQADAWFLDGFAPARNPELWEPGLMRAVHDRTRPGGTAATYSAAGAVRRALADAGFAVERRPGFGRKRHMTVARRP